MTDEPISRPGQAWRPWTVWLACGVAVVWSGLLVVADGLGAVVAFAWFVLTGQLASRT